MRHTQSPRRRLGALAVLSALALFFGLCGASASAADQDQGPGQSQDQDQNRIVDDPPVLATAAVLGGAPVDGILAGPMVAGGFHIHAHLRLYVNGVEHWVPAGVGVTRPVVLDPDRSDPSIKAAHSFYWLHTHDESGIIHAEAPTPHDFTLGQFFDLWGQPLSRHRVGPAQGDVTMYVDGKKSDGDPRAVVLKDHTQIQLDVGRDVPFAPYDFPSRY